MKCQIYPPSHWAYQQVQISKPKQKPKLESKGPARKEGPLTKRGEEADPLERPGSDFSGGERLSCFALSFEGQKNHSLKKKRRKNRTRRRRSSLCLTVETETQQTNVVKSLCSVISVMEVGRNLLSSPPSFPSRTTHLRNYLPSSSTSGKISVLNFHFLVIRLFCF